MSEKIEILGISAFYHDSAVCYIRDGIVVACLQEERFSRKKHDSAFPEKAISILKDKFGLDEQELNAVAFYDKPILKFERILANLISISPFGFQFAFKAVPAWIKEKLYVSSIIKNKIKGKYQISYIPHHISHAASAFYPSGFKSAAFIVNDGVGEWESTSWGVCSDAGIEIKGKIDYPHSLGMLYSAITYFCGFKVNSGEYKLMGLAPYGNPIYENLIKENLIDIKDDGSYRLNLKYLTYQLGEKMTGRKLERLFKLKKRNPSDPMTSEYADIAASIQNVLEDVLVKMSMHVRKTTRETNLVLSGGVALNCVANSKIIKMGGFENIFIQPASGDAGGALGAALLVAKKEFNMRFNDIQQFSFLGTSYTDDEIEEFLASKKLSYKKISNPAFEAAAMIEKGFVVGWFQGRMEYGPRALGARSILGDPRDPEMQKKMNLKIKFRESFRPFAPSIIEERHSDYFEENFSTPYMLTVSILKEKYRKINEHITHDFDILSKNISQVPSVIHADFTSRIQSVSRKSNPLYYELLSNFYDLTGVPMVINTSFNVRGQPIVESPYDAVRTFLNTEIDALVMGSYLLIRKEQKIDKGEFSFDETFSD